MYSEQYHRIKNLERKLRTAGSPIDAARVRKVASDYKKPIVIVEVTTKNKKGEIVL